MVQNHVEPVKTLLSSVKRNILVGKLCLFCIILALLHIILDTSQGLYKSAMVDVLFATVIGLAYLLNRNKFHKTSKIFVLLSLNTLFILFSSLLPREVGIYLYYFPLIVASSAFFDAAEKPLRFAFIALPLILLMLLFFHDFHILGDVYFQNS